MEYVLYLEMQNCTYMQSNYTSDKRDGTLNERSDVSNNFNYILHKQNRTSKQRYDIIENTNYTFQRGNDVDEKQGYLL